MNFIYRTATENDYDRIISVVNEWWDGRNMVDMLPRLFIVHFRNTSFVVEMNKELAAFLCGFISQANPEVTYIHFVGVNPKYRKMGLAKKLYNKFFYLSRQNGCREVHCVTSPVNKVSIAFHKKMGFQIKNGDHNNERVTFYANYDGPGQDRVMFAKNVADYCELI